MFDIIYLNLSPKMQSSESTIYVDHVAEITGSNQDLVEKIRKIPIHHFQKDHSREIVSQLKIIYCIAARYPAVLIIPTGSMEVILEYSKSSNHSKIWEIAKVIFVSGISFFGTAFTIMAFHNDIGIRDVFAQVAALIIGEDETGLLAVEIAYAVGLAFGIIVFFNHIGKRRLSHDPTPIEVSIRKYEDDVNQTLTETWDREGNTIGAP
jgi:stage V sporulation protein AA